MATPLDSLQVGQLQQIQTMTNLGIPRKAIEGSFKELGIPYASSLGKSGWLEGEGVPPSSFVYPKTADELSKVDYMLYAIARMSVIFYKRQIMVIELDTLIRCLNEGYTLRANAFVPEDTSKTLYQLHGLAILNFATEVGVQNTYAERELSRVKGLVTHMIRSGLSVHLGVATPQANAISTQWGKKFEAMLTTEEVTGLRLPLARGKI